MFVSPYLAFDGQCSEAMTFYAEMLRGEVAMMLPYRDSPMAAQMPAEYQERIMHARVMAEGVVLMASDSPPGGSTAMQGLHVSLMLDSVAEAERVFAALEPGAKVMMPLAETFWAERFAMLHDRFGTPWMLNVEKAVPPGG